MNCIRVLQVRNPCPRVTASDTVGAVPILAADTKTCRASSPPPLRSSPFFGNYGDRRSSDTLLQQCQPLPPCLSSDFAVATAAILSATPGIGKSASRATRKKPKRVVFADSQGLALAAVHVFDDALDDAEAELQFQLTEIEGVTNGFQLAASKYGPLLDSDLVLDFTPPSADYLDLRRRLEAQQICLETCSVHQCFLSGTVQVRNVCFQKLVWLRITFDSWGSFQDIQCHYVNNVYGCTHTDVFSFSVPVPRGPEVSDPVEFCLRFQAEERTFWDNNLGKNYRLVVVDHVQERKQEVECDPYGSPRTSVGIFAEWQSWGRLETGAPYW